MNIYKYTYAVFSGNQYNHETRVTNEIYRLTNTKENRKNFCNTVKKIDREFIDNDDFENEDWGVGFNIESIEVKE